MGRMLFIRMYCIRVLQKSVNKPFSPQNIVRERWYSVTNCVGINAQYPVVPRTSAAPPNLAIQCSLRSPRSPTPTPFQQLIYLQFCLFLKTVIYTFHYA